MRSIAILMVVFAAIASPCAAADPAGPPAALRFKTEIIVRTIRNLRSPAEVASFLDLAARYHVDVINLAVKQDEDDEISSGVVFYASAIAPRAPGYLTFDVLQAVIEEAHKRGMKIRAWVPQFHDQAAARLHPSWQMQAHDGTGVVPLSAAGGEILVNPLSPEVQAYERSIVAEIARNYSVDGIVLDWLRFDDYNMDVGPETRTRYREAFGYDPAAIDFSADNPQRTQWNAWRTAEIGAYVRSVSQEIHEIKPGLDLGAYILPPEFAEVGQDAEQFADHVGFLSPLAYFKDWDFRPSWVYRNLLPQVEAKARGVAVVPVLDANWSDAAYREILSNIRARSPRIHALAWFVYGDWSEAILQRIDRLSSW